MWDSYKVNCAALVDSRRGKIGFGIVIRNCNGDVMASCAQMDMENLSLKSAKLAAIYRSIQFSSDCGLTPCSFETDDACVVNWILNGDHRDSEVGVILADIDSLSLSLGVLSFSYSDTSSNRVAQGLAAAAIDMMEDTYWMEDFPNCVKTRVEAYKPS